MFNYTTTMLELLSDFGFFLEKKADAKWDRTEKNIGPKRPRFVWVWSAIKPIIGSLIASHIRTTKKIIAALAGEIPKTSV